MRLNFLSVQVQVHVLHTVTMGQSYGYPINERIRTQWLGGITYGYQDHP